MGPPGLSGGTGRIRMSIRSPFFGQLAILLQIKENRKLKFILPMLYYIDGSDTMSFVLWD